MNRLEHERDSLTACASQVQSSRTSAISVAAVAHAVDAHDAKLVGNLINYPLVAHADAPVVLAPDQLAATGRAWVRRQRLDCPDDAIVSLRGESGKFFFDTPFKQDTIHCHLRSAR
jgi:hypothetical protein